MLTEIILEYGRLMQFCRDAAPAAIDTIEKRQLGGGKFVVVFLEDGSALCGHYNAQGIWQYISPVTANDVFNLTGENELFCENVHIGSKIYALRKTVFEKLDEKLSLQQVQANLCRGESRSFQL